MMEEKWTNASRSRGGVHGLAALSYARLIRLKEEDDQHEFNKLMQPLLPDVKAYLAQRLSNTVRSGLLPSGKYKVEDFLDELYLRAYEQIGEVEDEKDLHPWLFKKSDELLQDAIVDEEFNVSFLKDINLYTRAEWDQMQEEFSAEGDGDLVMLEEFDDPSYPRYAYKISDVFVSDPQEGLMKELDAELKATEIHDHINMVLHHLPVPLRSVYDLAVNQGFKPYEIARIKGISVYQVEAYMAKVREIIRLSLKTRFLGRD